MTRDSAVNAGGTGLVDARPAGLTDVGRPRMRYTVDGWDPAYGASLELEEYLQESTAEVVVDLELPASQWRAIDARTDVKAPGAMLFVDGVRRIEARVWINSPADTGEAKRPRPGDRGDCGAMRLVRRGGGVLLRSEGTSGDGGTEARTVFHCVARERHQHPSWQVPGASCRRQHGRRAADGPALPGPATPPGRCGGRGSGCGPFRYP